MRNQPLHSSSAIYGYLHGTPCSHPGRQEGWDGRGQTDEKAFSLQEKRETRMRSNQGLCQAELLRGCTRTLTLLAAHNLTTASVVPKAYEDTGRHPVETSNMVYWAMRPGKSGSEGQRVLYCSTGRHSLLHTHSKSFSLFIYKTSLDLTEQISFCNTIL